MDKIWRQILTKDDTVSFAANENIKWTFIVELAPWMGGFYERIVGVVKNLSAKQ